MSRYMFLALNVVYAIFMVLVIPNLPDGLMFGWLPRQIFIYIIGLCVASVFWGTHMKNYLKKQAD